MSTQQNSIDKHTLEIDVDYDLNVDFKLLLREIDHGRVAIDKLLGGLGDDSKESFKGLNNPWRDEYNRDISVWRWNKNERYYFKDSKEETFKGDCFDMVRQLKGYEWYLKYGFSGVLRFIVKLCGVNPEIVRM